MPQTLEQLRTGKLTGLQRLKLSCNLTDFPREIFSLADTLEILDLSGNALSSLPDDLPRLRKLRIIFCSDNQFTELPEVLGQCPQLSMVAFKANRINKVPARALPAHLRWLILTDNQIEELPAELGNCHQLQKLALAGNRLQGLPATMSACTRLELVRISANRLRKLPDCLLSLPRLAWLAYAGNPFCEQQEQVALAATPVASVDWNALQIHDKLGEGASGVIYRAGHRQGSEVRPVAIKMFKGDVTSDGLPDSEMAAWLAAGTHPNLIPIQGRVTAHPAGATGLLMPLVDPAFHALAGPPSLDSCTRDIYAAGLAFEPQQILEIARGIASAARHLHERGILHGDLYAHNILHASNGVALLGDFGAATLYAPESQAAHALQRIEVRAFGYLLEELLERCRVPVRSLPRLVRLAVLATACLNHDASARPTFHEVEDALSCLVSIGQDAEIAG